VCCHNVRSVLLKHVDNKDDLLHLHLVTYFHLHQVTFSVLRKPAHEISLSVLRRGICSVVCMAHMCSEAQSFCLVSLKNSKFWRRVNLNTMARPDLSGTHGPGRRSRHRGHSRHRGRRFGLVARILFHLRLKQKSFSTLLIDYSQSMTFANLANDVNKSLGALVPGLRCSSKISSKLLGQITLV
jgi:hypothetical protein